MINILNYFAQTAVNLYLHVDFMEELQYKEVYSNEI